MGEKVNTYRPIDGRQWNGTTSPLPASPMATTNATDYFGQDSAPGSPTGSEFASNDGGRVRKKRSNSSAGTTSRNIGKGGRRRPSSGSRSRGREADRMCADLPCLGCADLPCLGLQGRRALARPGRAGADDLGSRNPGDDGRAAAVTLPR